MTVSRRLSIERDLVRETSQALCRVSIAVMRAAEWENARG